MAGLAVGVGLALAGALAGCGDSDSGTTIETPTVGSSHAAQARAAADWLAGQAGSDHVQSSTFDGTPYPDEGLTADTVLALLGTDQADAAAPFVDALSAPSAVTAYVGDGARVQYAGATAKLVATLSAAGRDPHDVSGRNLVAQLAGLEQASGRLSDKGPDDSSQTVSQAWGVIALSRPGAGQQAALTRAARYLANQQCDDGSFPAALEAQGCSGDSDATAFAVSALVAAGRPVKDSVLEDAGRWLQAQASTDATGTHWATGTPAVPSVGSTSVAALALQDLGIGTGGSVQWLVAQQVTRGRDAGALLLAGMPDARSTAQGALAIAGHGYDTVFG